MDHEINLQPLIKRTVSDVALATRLKPSERVLVANATERLAALALTRAAVGKQTKAQFAEAKAIKATLLSLGEVRAVAVEKAIRDSLRTAISAGLALL